MNLLFLRAAKTIAVVADVVVVVVATVVVGANILFLARYFW